LEKLPAIDHLREFIVNFPIETHLQAKFAYCFFYA
jgi:hypothetical protein